VGKRETDISLIRKYLNGELDAQTMHQLERRAQNDPFLMDALEGYEKAGSDQQAQLNELASRLKQRITRKERHIIPWKVMAVAASALVICSVGVWWLYNDHPNNTPKLALIVKPVAKATPAEPVKAMPLDKSTVAALKKTPRTTLQAQKVVKPNEKASVLKTIPVVSNNVANVNIKDSAAKDTTPLNEVVVMGYTSKAKKNSTASVAAVEVTEAKKIPVSSSERLVQGHMAGVTVTAGLKSRTVSKKIIKGRVIGKDDGLPITGASVRVAGTNIGAVTDVNGQFTLAADSNKSKLVVANIGYQTLQINIHNRDSVKTISLQPTNNSLNEIVVTGYTSQKNTDEPAMIYAHPKAGWNSFRKYLKENAHSPDGKTGVVKLSFMVDNNGVISGIKIEKGLSQATDQAAIDLINDGPDWVGNTNSEPEKVNLKIKFVK